MAAFPGRALRGAALSLLLTLSGASFAAEYKEAPGLSELVKGGKLPPVAQRLPEKPLVLSPVEKTGKYGGTWRQALMGGSDSLIERSVGYTRLVRWNRAWTAVEPDVAEKVDVKPDGTEYVFHLRKGTRWSDGAPFTADDLVFWYQDVLMNKELTPSVPRWLRSGNDPVIVEKIDDVTVKFRFTGPNGMLLENIATTFGSDILAAAPAHYLKQFHKKYNPEGIDKLVAEAKAANWSALFLNKTSFPGRWRATGRPVLDPWQLTVPYGGTTQVVLERNPYYFKVDPEGRQLPYIDRVTFDIMGDQQAIVLKAINGELDMQNQRLNGLETRIVLAQNRERSGYRLFKAQPAWSNAMCISLNQTSKNPVLREVFRNRDVRVALSLAINREELNELIYAGQSQPYQAAPRPGTALYDEQMATQYTKFDPKGANELLDKAGFAKRDGQKFRLGPDGKRISFAVDAATSRRYQIDALELIKKYWAAVGIEMQVKTIEESFAFARMLANEHDAMVWIGGGGYDFLGVLDPKWYFPYENQAAFASAWGIYFQNPNDPNAEEPPEPAKRQQALYVEMQKTPGTAGQFEVMKKILAITREQFYVIGTNMDADNYGVVKNNMRNVPELMPDTFFYMTPGPTNPEQYFYE
jgi:peptide/nickel transport system substrate-binding protein